MIARVGSKEHILLGDVIGDVNKEFAQLAPKYHPKDHEALRQMLIYKYVKQMIPMKVLFAEARSTIPDDKMPEVMKQIDGIFMNSVLPLLLKENKLRSEEEFDAKLKAEGSSLKQLKQTFGETQIVQQFIADHTEVDKEVSPDELLGYYRAHYEEYKYEAKVRWEQLLVKFKRSTKQEALAKLADMGNQVRNGAAWADVAKSSSEGYTAEKGGAHDWTTKGSLKFESLDQALFTLPIGEMSQMLIDKDDAQIVRVVDRQPAGAKSFEETQADIKKLIVDERVKVKKSEFIKSVLEEHRPAIWTIFDEQELAADKDQQKQNQGPSTARRATGRQSR
ncbi:MAG TPA: peptidyl-prolyl cis-trans isomerase [Pirellulales bacterium]|nr:peptidyl-prolyl cis-trans isomerase [Pirellulales bacterium]